MISAINEAAKQLRLNPEKVEVLHLVEDWLTKRQNLQEDILYLKRITETSKLAIRLQEISDFLSTEQINYKKFSENFIKHCNFLVMDLDFLLLNVNQYSMKRIFERIQSMKDNKKGPQAIQLSLDIEEGSEKEETQEFRSGKIQSQKRSLKIKAPEQPELPFSESDKRDEQRGVVNREREFLYGPIRDLEELITRMKKEDFRSSEIFKFSDICDERVKFCRKNQLEVLANSFANISKALRLIYDKELSISAELIQYFRASMIVIVTEIRGLDHDISEYQLRDKIFTETLKVYKKEV